MSCGYSPTPPAACAWSAHSPSKPTKTGSKPTATSIWTNCASRRKPNYAKPHDQHHDRQFAELDAHNRWHLHMTNGRWCPRRADSEDVSYRSGSGSSCQKAELQRSSKRRRSEEHTSELQSLMRSSYAASCLTK